MLKQWLQRNVEEFIAWYIFRYGRGALKLHRKGGAIQIARIFSEHANEKIVQPAFDCGGVFYTQKQLDAIIAEYNTGWIPVSERYPESNTLVLLSFENIDVQMVGVYEEDGDGGAFYLIANGKSCISCDLFVNAWRPLLAVHKEDMQQVKQTNADKIRAMSDEELAMNMMCPNENGLGEIECNKDDSCNCYECILKWLQKEADA